MDWSALIHAYARTCRINYYHAAADVAERRHANGDDEASRWFQRVIAGEGIAWNDLA